MPAQKDALGHRIESLDTLGLKARCLPVEIDGVVSVYISYPVPFSGEPAESLLQHLAVGMLDRGTERLAKDAFSAAVEDTGAQLSFSSDTGWVHARLRCLTRDVDLLVALLSECLRTPRFDADEVLLLRQQLSAALMRQRTNTSVRASRALRRRLYPSGHPHYAQTVQDELSILESISPEAVVAGWKASMQPSAMRVAMVGDMSAEMCRTVLSDKLGAFSMHSPDAVSHIVDVGPGGGREHVHVPDRSNLDVRVGHAIGMLRSHADYEALYAGLFILGGNFSGRLMSTVRDRDGLTYGVRSALAGAGMHWNGTWDTSISLSASNLERGIERTLEEIDRFVEEGVTEAEAETVGVTLSGSYLVHLGTTGGMASTMRRHLERGQPASEIDAYPARMEALTADQINDAVRTWLRPASLWTCSAGTRQ